MTYNSAITVVLDYIHIDTLAPWTIDVLLQQHSLAYLAGPKALSTKALLPRHRASHT